MSYSILRKISSTFGFEDTEKYEELSGPVPVVRAQFKIRVYEPKQFNDLKQMADALLDKSAVLIHFDQVDSALRRRIIDHMNGLGYAVGAGVEKISESIVVYVPENVSIDKEVLHPVKTSKWF